MSVVTVLKEKALSEQALSKQEALSLMNAPLQDLCQAANELRRHFCGNIFDLCTIINGKSGKCSENCKYCAQSSFYSTKVEEYPLLSTEPLLKEAQYNEQRGVLRYSIVTSGKALSNAEVDTMCDSIRVLRKETGLSVCASFGLLHYSQFKKLREAGLSRVHNNLETSRNNFPNVCTTHTFEDKLRCIAAAKEAGLSVCSGGIFGLGETVEDRIDLALELRSLGVRSVPINLLNPIAGTPYENNRILSNDELCQMVAVFRFLLPDAFLRLAGGRGLLPDLGEQCFQSGANAAITGDMLTTSGITIEQDLQMLQKLGYKVALMDD